MIKVCIAGATGNVGSLLAKAINNSDELKLTEALSKNNEGKNLGSVLNYPELNLVLKENVAELDWENVDVLIDYTTPDSVKQNVIQAILKKI